MLSTSQKVKDVITCKSTVLDVQLNFKYYTPKLYAF